jgi:ABC-type glycerol-3-phosphate transport system substrate-binding protein
VDPDALRALVKGKTAAEAQAALAPFGSGTVTLWPNWVSTIPSVDSRLTITVNDVPPGGAAPDASSAPPASPPSASGPAGSASAPSKRPATSGAPAAASSAP